MQKYNEPELKAALKNFEKLLKEQPDDMKAIIPVKNFLKNFIRIRCKSLNIPTAEIMAILKYKKPTLHYHLKKTSTNDPTFHFLTNINMDYDKAIQRLDEIKKLIS